MILKLIYELLRALVRQILGPPFKIGGQSRARDLLFKQVHPGILIEVGHGPHFEGKKPDSKPAPSFCRW